MATPVFERNQPVLIQGGEAANAEPKLVAHATAVSA